MSEYHVPVLLNESVDGLEIKPGGVYLDLNFWRRGTFQGNFEADGCGWGVVGF